MIRNGRPKLGGGANSDPKVTLMRKAGTASSNKAKAPKPSLPKLKCLEEEPDDGEAHA